MSGLKISKCERCGIKLNRDNAKNHLLCRRCYEIEEEVRLEEKRKRISAFGKLFRL